MLWQLDTRIEVIEVTSEAMTLGNSDNASKVTVPIEWVEFGWSDVTWQDDECCECGCCDE